MPPPKRNRAPSTDIDRANMKTDREFSTEFLGPRQGWEIWNNTCTETQYAVDLVGAPRLSANELKTCFDLVEHTSKADYEWSADGWKPRLKLKEMKSPELRYLLVHKGPDDDLKNQENDGHGKTEKFDIDTKRDRQIEGFASVMPTFEAGIPVLYCYEIHLSNNLLGTGLGRYLMNQIISMATKIPSIEKVMLTCFLSNTHAHEFYRKLDFTTDENSPGPRVLRGKTFEPDFVILSREVQARSLGPDNERVGGGVDSNATDETRSAKRGALR